MSGSLEFGVPFALVFLVLPLILLLLSVTRRKPELVRRPSLMLWRLLARRRSTSILHRWMPALRRIVPFLALTLLVAASSRPRYVTETVGGSPLLVVLDATSSMKARDGGDGACARYEAAVRRLRSIAASRGVTVGFAVWRRDVRRLSSWRDAAAVPGGVGDVERLDRFVRTVLGAARAETPSGGSPAGASASVWRRLHLLSDFSLPARLAEGWNMLGGFSCELFGNENSFNAGLVSWRQLDISTDSLREEFRLAWCGLGSRRRVSVAALRSDTPLARCTVALQPGCGTTSVALELPLARLRGVGEPLEIRLEGIEGDVLADDDCLWMLPWPGRTVIEFRGRHPASFDRLLELLPAFSLEGAFMAAEDGTSPACRRIVVSNGVSPPAAFAEGLSSVWFLPPVQCAWVEGRVEASPLARGEPGAGRHPLLEAVEPFSLEVGKWAARVKVPEGARVLLRCGAAPWLVVLERGEGRVVLCGSTLEDMEKELLYPLLLSNILRWAAGDDGGLLFARRLREYDMDGPSMQPPSRLPCLVRDGVLRRRVPLVLASMEETMLSTSHPASSSAVPLRVSGKIRREVPLELPLVAAALLLLAADALLCYLGRGA